MKRCFPGQQQQEEVCGAAHLNSTADESLQILLGVESYAGTC
jgi:hypothetical protein